MYADFWSLHCIQVKSTTECFSKLLYLFCVGKGIVTEIWSNRKNLPLIIRWSDQLLDQIASYRNYAAPVFVFFCLFVKSLLLQIW